MVSVLIAAACVGPQHATTASPSPSGRPGLPPTSLHITGSLRANTNPAGGANQCVPNQPLRGQLTITTPGMSLPDGQELRVEMTLGPGPGIYSAVVPTASGVTPVRVERLSSLPGGTRTGLWNATSGTVTVEHAGNVGGPGADGILSGSVDAQLTLPNGSVPIRVYGPWSCYLANNR